MSIRLNFIQPLSPAMRALRYMLPSCGVLLMGLVLLQYNQLSNRSTSLAWQLRDQQGSAGVDMSRGMRISAAHNPEDEEARAAEILHQLDMPWNALFEALENAIDQDIVMLSVWPNATQHAVTLQAVATDSDAAISFANRLQASPLLSDIHLVQEEPREEVERYPLKFSISARWGVTGDAS